MNCFHIPERKLDSFVTCKKSDVFETGSDILNNSSSSKQVADNDRINAFTGDSSVSLSSDSGLSVGSSTETDRDSYSASSQETVTSLESFPSERSISLTFHSHTAERDCEQTTPCVLSDDVNEENSSRGIDNLPSRTEFLHGEISVCDTIKLASETGCKINGNDSLRDSAIDDHESNSRTCSDSSFEKRLNEKQFSITVHKTSGDTDNNLENSIEQQSIKHSRLKAGDSSWPKVNDHSGFKMETVKTEEECSIILHQLVSNVQHLKLGFEPQHDIINKVTVRPAKTQIRPVRSESSLCTQWAAKEPSFLHATAKTDQTGRMPRLI